jgi:hypothetical protein
MVIDPEVVEAVVAIVCGALRKIRTALVLFSTNVAE